MKLLSELYKQQLLEDVFNAYFRARRNKRNTQSQLAYEMNLEGNLTKLYEELLARSYEPMPSYCFIVNHPVKREVFASQFRDRVVHRLLFDYIEPVFERRFIYDSYSCRIGKGTSEGIRRIEHHIRSCTNNYTRQAWVLKLDLKGYFMSINKQRVYDIVSGTMERHWQTVGVDSDYPGKDPLFIDYLLRQIIFKDPTRDVVIRSRPEEWEGLPPSKSLLKSEAGDGLPIGDLTSQLFSNIYMDVFDNYAKRDLHLRHYGRYVDDFFVVHTSKGFLLDLIETFRNFLWERFALTLHPDKIYLQDCRKGVAFLGAHVKPHRCYSVRRTVQQFRQVSAETRRELSRDHVPEQTLERIRARYNSYLGYLGAFKSRRIIRKNLAQARLFRYFTYSSQQNAIKRRKE